MSKVRISKLASTVVVFHVLVAALLIIAYLLLVLGGTTMMNGSDGPIERPRYEGQAVFLVAIAYALSVPTLIVNTAYFKKHLKPRNRLRIPVIISISIFGFFGLILPITLVLLSFR